MLFRFALRQSPAQPAECIGEQPDFARAAFVNGLNGNEFDFSPGGEKGDEHFGFDLKTIRAERQLKQGFQMRESETAL